MPGAVPACAKRSQRPQQVLLAGSWTLQAVAVTCRVPLRPWGVTYRWGEGCREGAATRWQAMRQEHHC